MPETTVSAEISTTFLKLRAYLNKNKYRVVSENPPQTITAVYGSIWGMSGKTAKRQTTYTLRQEAEGTRVSFSSKLTNDYKNLTLTGYVFSVALMLLCLWIGFDLLNYASTGMGYWGWLAQTSGLYGHFEPEIANVLIRVFWAFSAFLAATLIAETVIVYRVLAKIGASGKDVLRALQG